MAQYGDDFLNALANLGQSVQRYGIGQAVNKANEQVQKIKAEMQPGVEQRQALSSVAQDVFLRLQAGGADPQAAALVYQNLMPKTPNNLEQAMFSDDPTIRQAAFEMQEEQDLRRAQLEQQKFAQQMALTERLEAGRDRRANAAMERQQEKAAKAPTSANGIAATYAADLIQANRNYELLGKGAGSGTISNFLNRNVPGALQSESFQKMTQAQNQFIDAILRKRTGATAKPEEIDNYRGTYFPVGGDSDAVVQQKARTRAQLVQSMLLEAGPAAESAAAIAGGPSALGMRGVDLSQGTPKFNVNPASYARPPRR